MKTHLIVVLLSLVVAGCAGFGVRVAPDEGLLVAVEVRATDCIPTGNLIGRSLAAIPYVGDFVILQYGCPDVATE